MSEIKCNVQQIFIKPHPNADALELANIGSTEGWQCVVKKGQYKTGDYVVYIPENAVVPSLLHSIMQLLLQSGAPHGEVQI